MTGRLLRSIVVAGAALAAIVAPAAAEFSASDMNALVTNLNAREGLNAAQEKVKAQVNAAASKSYAAFSQELAVWSKLVKALKKAFPGDSAMDADIALIVDGGDGIDDTFFNLVFTNSGTGAAGVALNNNLDIAKAAKIYFAKVVKHFNKGNEQTDPSKKLKFWSKARKGAEGILRKYPYEP